MESIWFCGAGSQSDSRIKAYSYFSSVTFNNPIKILEMQARFKGISSLDFFFFQSSWAP